MKKLFTLFIAILFIAILFNSCKKSSDNKPATTAISMKFTSNDTVISFNSCTASTGNINGTDAILIIGDNITNPVNSFEIVIVHSIATLKAGQSYPAGTAIGQAESSRLFFDPIPPGDFITQPGNPEGIVTIAGVTSTTITGTFSGKLYDENDIRGTTLKYNITNGSFTATIVN